MSEEQLLQFPEDMTDEEIAAAVVVAAISRHKTAAQTPIERPKSSREGRDWIDSGRPGHKPTWKHPT